ncbi:MAG: O-methyltransferase [Bacillota bacterium]|nr:MAG: O-methyltransferase [Bacillota bacterium]MBS3950234.1 O-methyltransferase [Peptococcaceae bacterium]
MWEQLPERAVRYARAQLTYPLPLLREIEEQAKAQKVPIVPPEVAAFLCTLVRLVRPQQVLEIGCGAAFSTLWMAAALPPGARLYGLDRDYNRSLMSNANIRLAGRQDKITIEQKDATSEDGKAAIRARAPYDFIFIDCEKRVYPELWGLCSELTRPGGIIVADNVLFRGLVGEGAAAGRNSRGVAALQEFLDLARNDVRYTSQIIPLGDGLLVAIKEDTHG